MRNSIVAGWMLLALGALVTPEVATAKSCRRLCRAAIRSCVNEVRRTVSCAGQQGTAKRDCRRTRSQAIGDCKGRRGLILQTCYARPEVPTCSPSGAFLDPE